MQSYTWNIVIGVVTGLITASFLLVIKSLFTDSFIPWYRQMMYKGLKLDGSWHSAENAQKILLEFKQSCEKLSGKATVHLAKGEVDKKLRDQLHIDDIRTFDVQGEIRERFVSLRLKHTDPTRIGMVTYLLQVEGDGTRLTGQGCWYSPISSTISSGGQTFYRDESRAIKAAKSKVEAKNDIGGVEVES